MSVIFFHHFILFACKNDDGDIKKGANIESEKNKVNKFYVKVVYKHKAHAKVP